MKANYSSNDFYKYYKTTCPNVKMSKSEYVKILKEYYDEIINFIIFKSSVFHFPGRLGNLKIVQYKKKLKLLPNGSLDKRRLRPDWEATKNLWNRVYDGKNWEEILEIRNKPIVYHENKHTCGFSHKWHWDKTTCNVVNSTIYAFVPSRTNKRKLAKALKNPDNDLYYHITQKE